ncbi:sugar kinase [Donghicola eburneus]|jgi:fructokinase|uniref:PfkB family sugar kinase n=1 Tax=Donghicola eburneus TaxID=393278 RepID=A0A1M4MVW4_9RHOB|nr:sugar kinase [Donghicola eburneus]SCM66650.1 PfkB family sugar kinase [Donghicola eburneus]SFQ73929.1 Sugar or nucleoside kinase, ribokinase family [Donghicola eburneus]
MTNETNLAPDALGPTLCIGEILAEIVATTAGEGFLDPVPLIGPYPSGAPAIFVDQAGRIGGAAAMVGSVGNDDFGRANIARLKGDGVDVSGIRTDPVLPTGTAFVRYRPDGARDFVFNMWTSAAGALAWDDRVEPVCARAGHLHVMGTLLGHQSIWEMTERAAAMIKARGGTISLDPNMRKELRGDGETGRRFARMVGMADLLLPSGDELYLAADLPVEAGEEAALERLFQSGVKEVAIKRGADGATCALADGSRTHSPAFAVTEMDPTGAGDCFGGAYVACRRLGMTPSQALTYANAAGARNVTFRGPMEGAGTRDELDQFISETKRLTRCP